MKKILLLSLFLTLYFSGKTLAQIASWDFTGQSTLPTSTATSSDLGLASVPVLTRGPGAVASAGNNSFRTVGFQNNGISVTNTDYFQVTLTASAGKKISLSSIDALFAGTATYYANTGVSSQYAYSLDGTNFTLIGSPSAITSTLVAPNAAPTVNLSGISALQNVASGTTITIRYYASGQTATGGWGFNSPATGRIGFSIGGSVTASGSVDTTPPTNTIDYPKTASITSTTVNFISNINESGKTYFVVIPAMGTPPTTSAQIRAGNDGNNVAAFKSGSIANLANTDATTTISGLTLSTAYRIYVVSEDLAGTPNLQPAFTTLNFSTLGAADITPPITASGYPKTSNATQTSIDFTTNINEVGTSYYVLLPSGSTAPSPAQVKAGLDATDAPAPKSGSIINTANADATATINGLTSGTTYTLYVVAQDLATNLQALVATVDATTANPPLVSAPIIISQYYEGTSVNKWIELTNLSNAPINTASPQLKLALYNISGDAGNINITGSPSQIVNLNFTIPARGSVLLGNTGNSNTEVPYLTTASAILNSNTVINFNGNDGVALLDANNNIIDAFGQGVNAKDVSYVRSLNVTAPSPAYNDLDWTRTPIATVQNAIDDDDANRLGVHFPPNLPVCAAPSTPATALVFNSVTTNSISASFTKSTDANEYLIIRSLNTSLTALPSDGTAYNVGSAFGGGVIANRIVTNTFTDNALADATNYNYFIIPLNNISCTGGPKYLTNNILTARQATKTLSPCATPTTQPTNFTITSSNYNFVQGAFTASANADEYLVVMSTTNTLASAPVNQTTYSVGDQLGGGIVVKRGTGNTFIRNGLTQNTNYYFFIFSINSACSGGPLYLTAQPLLGNFKTGVLDVNKLNFYYGNLHSHSSYSDGNKDDLTKKPEDDYAFAKNSMNLDFLGISEHNHTQAGMSLASWQPGIDAAKKATTSNFVAMHGMEWGVISGGGHVIVYGIDSLIGWESGENQIYVPKSVYTGNTGLFRIINRHGLNAVATLAHPNTTDYNNISATYDLSADSAIVGTALESGPAFSTNVTYSDPASSMSYLSYYNRMLARGYHLGASIDHDNHNLTFGRHTRARMVVLAPALTENDLLDAIKKMRFYASQDSAAKIVFTINKQPVGSIFKTAGPPQIEVNSITTSPVTSIKILYGTPGSGINPVELTTSTSTSLTYTDNALANLATGYYYADIVEADGSRIITSPIWYTRDDAVVKKAQNITFAATRTATYGDADLPAGATSDNTSINITYTSSDTNIATITNTDIHILKAGTVTITASQPGDTFFNPAVAKQQVLTINPKTINVTANAKTKVEGTVDPPLTYTSTPALLGTDAFTGTLVRVAGEAGGDYAINQGTLAINSNYAINYTSANFHIIPKPVANISGNSAVCINGTSPTITFTGTKGTAPYTFTYNINGGANRTVSSTSTTSTATISASTNTVGTFVYNLISVADANTNQAQAGAVAVIVNPLPVVSINSDKGISISKGDAIILTATGGSQYQWTGAEIITGQLTSSVTIRPKQSGIYRVTVTNASGCSTDQTISITVIDDYKLEASSVVTPNGDGINDKFIIKNIDYYPNNTLKIFDKAGRVLYTKQTYANDWDGTVNGTPLSEGTYYYILDLGSNLGNFKGFINIIRD